MFDAFTGWKIGVESTEADGAYVIVTQYQAGTLRQLLGEHRVPYAVDGEVPSRHHAGAPAELVIRLGPEVEASHVQSLIDTAP